MEKEERMRRIRKKKMLRRLALALLLVPLVYLGIQLYPLFHPTYQTETAISYTLADGVQVEGIAVRREVVLERPATADIGYLVMDGSRISAGSVVAEGYAGAQQSRSRAEEQRLDAEIAMLGRSQDPAQTAQGDVEIILDARQDALFELLRYADNGRYGALADAKNDLTLAANRLQVATGQTAGFEERIAALTAQRDAAAAGVGEVGYLYAPTAGYFSSVTDGLETVFTAAALDGMSASEVISLIRTPQTAQPAGAGKIISDYKWNYYCIVPAEKIARFENDRDGKVTVDFAYSEAKEIPARIRAITMDEASGDYVVKLECSYMNADTVDLRYESASVNFASYTGLRIDREAAHIVDGQWGVYIRYGDLVRFKNIAPIYENDEYMLLPVQSTASDSINQVVLYDEVIVSGRDLYDGKLL